MSFMDIECLSARELIAQYIITCRQRGLCLTYREYESVDAWLTASGGDRDAVLLVLSDLLPAFFAAPGGGGRPKPITILHRSVLRRLDELARQQLRPVPMQG